MACLLLLLLLLLNLENLSRPIDKSIIGNDVIKNVGKSGSCMVSKSPIIFKRTRRRDGEEESTQGY